MYDKISHGQIARGTCSASYLGMGQVQNGRLYRMYTSSSQKNEAEDSKTLQTTFLCYSNDESILLVLLTFIKFEKTKHINLDLFIFFLSFFLSFPTSSSDITQNYTVWAMLCISNNCSANRDHFYQFWVLCELSLVSYGHKTVSQMWSLTRKLVWLLEY